MKKIERYYYYISDAKVDMLLPQIPGALQEELSAELGFDIGVLKGKIGGKRTKLADRVSRVEVVEQHLLRAKQLANDVESAWFSGTMVGKPMLLMEASEAIFFWGTAYGRRLLFAGSSAHMVGGEATERVSVSMSFLPRLVHTLLKIAEGEEEKEKLIGFSVDFASKTRIGDEEQDLSWKKVIHMIGIRSGSLPDERLTFVARRLMTIPSEDKVVLGTPLFIAADGG